MSEPRRPFLTLGFVVLVGFVSAGLAVGNGCALGAAHPREDEQIRVARAFARDHGVAVEKYRVLNVATDGPSAHVLFRNDNGAPGDHFTVVVDIASGKAARIIPGK